MLTIENFEKISVDAFGHYYSVKFYGEGRGDLYTIDIEPMLFDDVDVAFYIGEDRHRFVMPKVRFFHEVDGTCRDALDDALTFCSHLHERYKYL